MDVPRAGAVPGPCRDTRGLTAAPRLARRPRPPSVARAAAGAGLGWVPWPAIARAGAGAGAGLGWAGCRGPLISGSYPAETSGKGATLRVPPPATFVSVLLVTTRSMFFSFPQSAFIRATAVALDLGSA